MLGALASAYTSYSLLSFAFRVFSQGAKRIKDADLPFGGVIYLLAGLLVLVRPFFPFVFLPFFLTFV